MAIKKVMVSLDGTLVSDMDKLVKAGCYKNRSALIHDALMQIAPLKALADNRFEQFYKDALTPGTAANEVISALKSISKEKNK